MQHASPPSRLKGLLCERSTTLHPARGFFFLHRDAYNNPPRTGATERSRSLPVVIDVAHHENRIAKEPHIVAPIAKPCQTFASLGFVCYFVARVQRGLRALKGVKCDRDG